MSELARLPDWRSRLVRYIASVASARFRPGRHDCALFAAGAVEAQTGIDFARGWRGYRSLADGQRRLRAAGHADHVALVAAHLPEIEPIFARAGDVAVLDGEIGQSVGIVQGPMIYVLAREGLGLHPLTDARRAFRV